MSRALGKPCAIQGSPDHEQQVAVMDVFGGVAGLAAEHLAVDPEVAGLLLRQRVEDVAEPIARRNALA